MPLTRRRLIKGTCAMALVLVSQGPGAHAAEDTTVGTVLDIVNVAWGTPPGRAREEIEHEDPTFMQELLQTEDESALVIQFADGSKLTMGENSEMVIDEFVYDPAQGLGAQAITLTKGAFRYVSGAVAKENIKIETPTATLGVRGTELVIDIDALGEVEASTEDGEAVWTPRSGAGQVFRVGKGRSLIIGADGRLRGGLRRFVHRSRSLAVADGLEKARGRWKIRKERRKRALRRIKNQIQRTRQRADQPGHQGQGTPTPPHRPGRRDE